VESRDLHPQRGILEGNRLVAVQQESNESNETQQKVWHGAQIVGFDCHQSQGVIGGRNNGDAQAMGVWRPRTRPFFWQQNEESLSATQILQNLAG